MVSPSSAPSVIDPHAQTPAGKPCEACGTPVESLDKFCAACGTANPDFPQGVAPRAATDGTRSVSTTYFKCQQCGAEVATDPNQRSYVCPFCDSTYVLEFSPDRTGRQ